MKSPDEIFALNETQKQIDQLVARVNDIQKRTEAIENLTASMVHLEDERNTIELKGMMTNLKSKFSFLDPNVDTIQQSKKLTNQIALLEEQFSSMQKLVKA